MEEKKFKVVIADDNRELREAVRDFIILKKSNMFEVVALAGDGVQAIDAVTEYRPDILILDVLMPKLDGRGVLQKLKLLQLEKSPKVFVVSSVGYDGVTQRILNMGVNYYMVKSFDFNSFLDALELLANSKTEIEKMHEYILDIKKEETKNIDDKIDDILYQAGVPINIKGHKYLKTAIMEILEDKKLLHKLTTELYPRIAKKHFTTKINVERSMRVAIEIAYKSGKMEDKDTNRYIKQGKKSQKMSNSEFINYLMDKIDIG